MQTTPVGIVEVNPYSTWTLLNAAVLCHRMAAIITAAACEENQRQSVRNGGDLRCLGCGGLDKQTSQLSAEVRHTLEWRNGDTATEDNIDAGAALDEIIDMFYDDPAPGDDFDDIELDLDDEQLLDLFPELASDEDTHFQRFTEYQAEMPRYAVFHGRCKKCGGFVENYREWHDDNAFRCLACGWRTGVEYENNRATYGVTL